MELFRNTYASPEWRYKSQILTHVCPQMGAITDKCPTDNTARTTSSVVTPVCPPVYWSLCLLDSRAVYMAYMHASILSCFHKRYCVYKYFSNSVRLTGSYLALPGISIVWSPSYVGRVTFCERHACAWRLYLCTCNRGFSTHTTEYMQAEHTIDTL